MRAPLPENEPARLAALDACAILDTSPEEVFTELAAAAAYGCGVGIGLISLVDRDRQWFKAALGVSAKETPRDVAFCAHAILTPDLFEIPDARLDPRFCDNPFVVGELGVRFYAGAPIELADGSRVGTLCVIDRQPRSLSEEQRFVLRTLAKQTALRLDLRRMERERESSLAEQIRARHHIEALSDELRREEAHFKTLIEAIPQLVWTTTPDGQGDYYNRRWIEYTGMSGEPRDNPDLIDVFHPDDRAACFSKWTEAVATGSSYELEYRMRRASDGAYRWHLGRAVPLRGDDGRIVKWFGTCTDIDDQRRAKDALLVEQQHLDARVRERTAQLQVSSEAQRSSEGRLRTLIDCVPIGIFETDTEGNCLFVNQGWERLTGLKNEEAKGKGWRRALHAEDLERVSLGWESATRVGEDFRSEHRYRTPRGVVWGSNASVALRDSAGKVTGYLGTVIDVTERRNAEAMVLRLAAVVESSPDAIFSVTLDGIVTDWNEGAERMFGYASREIVGRSFFTLIPADRVDEHVEILNRLERGETVNNVETVRVRKGGEIIDVSVSISAVRDGSGAIVGLSRILRDITAAKRVAAELARAKATAEAATRAKSDFLANMSHEIRTPMTAVLGFTDLLLDRATTESDRLNYLMTIRRNGEHLLAVLNDILDFSKIEAGKLSTEQIECSVCEILGEVESLMRVRARERGLAFEIAYASPIPATIASDPTRLRQIVLNLVSNAIKFTERGSVRVEARCEGASTDAPELVLDIVDTGIGLTKEQIACLFQPFSQADASTTRRYGGSGLGLGICAPLAVALGGKIIVTSEPGRGSTFTLRLGLARTALDAMIHAPDAAALTGRTSGHSDRAAPPKLAGRVLLAEDGQDNQVLISRLLQSWGVEVSLVDNGRAAATQAMSALTAGRPFDLILMDMQMPEMDGYGAAAQLRAGGYRGKIVALTANAMTGERERCLLAGCDDYLRKPIERAAVWATVALCVSQQAVSVLPGAREPSVAPTAHPPASGEEAAPAALYSVYADDPDFAEIVGDFVAGLPVRLGAMQEALLGRDLGTLRSLAHQLRGSAGSYGFLPITVAAARVEDALTRGERESCVAGDLASLVALCAQACSGSAPVLA
ncbi:MAG: PAS domain S-box protein [Byssovorax sp.]